MLAIFVILSLASPLLVKASLQTPTLTSCSTVQQVKVDTVTIQNAKIGQMMVINYTLTITQPLNSDPTLQVSMKRQSGSAIPCFDGSTCNYKLCGGTTSFEQSLGQLWNNTCPVPAITVTQTVKAELDPFIQLVIGFAPTTINVQLQVTNGGSVVGCQKFPVSIAKA